MSDVEAAMEGVARDAASAAAAHRVELKALAAAADRPHAELERLIEERLPVARAQLLESLALAAAEARAVDEEARELEEEAQVTEDATARLRGQRAASAREEERRAAEEADAELMQRLVAREALAQERAAVAALEAEADELAARLAAQLDATREAEVRHVRARQQALAERWDAESRSDARRALEAVDAWKARRMEECDAQANEQVRTATEKAEAAATTRFRTVVWPSLVRLEEERRAAHARTVRTRRQLGAVLTEAHASLVNVTMLRLFGAGWERMGHIPSDLVPLEAEALERRLSGASTGAAAAAAAAPGAGSVAHFAVPPNDDLGRDTLAELDAASSVDDPAVLESMAAVDVVPATSRAELVEQLLELRDEWGGARGMEAMAEDATDSSLNCLEGVVFDHGSYDPTMLAVMERELERLREVPNRHGDYFLLGRR